MLELLKDNQCQDMYPWCFFPNDQVIKLIDKLAIKINQQSDYFFVIGSGGSYSGCKAVIEFLEQKSETKIVFLNQLDQRTSSWIEKLKNEDISFSVNYVSKSGSTFESNVIFKHIEEILLNRYGMDEAKKRIIMSTCDDSAMMKTIEQKDYETIVIPTNLGGRFSVFVTALLPMAVAGHNLNDFVAGGRDFSLDLAQTIANYRKNAVDTGKKSEILSLWDQSLYQFGLWYDQLCSESEGKDFKNMLITKPILMSDGLHFFEQAIQEGPINSFIETAVSVDFEHLLSKYNQQLYTAARQAHEMPFIEIKIKKTEFEIGKIMMTLMAAVIMYCLAREIVPFGQPGVEKYKDFLK